MTVQTPRLPDDAPFTPAERAWIDGFLAGLFGTPGTGATPETAASSAPAADAPEDFPWHDATLRIDERLQLAEGRPRVRRMMAAMAQQDCGQCGYLCQTYAEAIESGTETSLSRCVPGGKETSRKLKELIAEAPGPAAVAVAPMAPAPAAAAAVSPLAAPQTEARFEGALRLTRETSAKDTRHVVFHLEDAKARYDVGDAFAVFATNCPDLAAAVIDRLGGTRDDEVECPDGRRRALFDALVSACDITRPSDNAVEVLASRATGPGESDRLQALAEGYPGAEPADADLLDLLDAFPSARPPIQELISALSPLQPRLYSIASSLKAVPGQVHLTVDTVRYERRRRLRKGVASTFLAERARAGSAVPVSFQAAHNFRLGKPDAPIIMIGPGTGVAPFRAFLQERRATGATGRNWLFFGSQHRTSDFLYEEDLESFRADGLLTRLDTAFSRDQADKIYVQHRMREAGAELWAWLQDGAHVYVCGDAQRMARDVDTALTMLVAKHGRMEMAAAKTYVASLGREGRYQRDVY
ncbi:MAG TPA: sulfite reductase subunit alpha [Alphaproteobacteria bacterium]